MRAMTFGYRILRRSGLTRRQAHRLAPTYVANERDFEPTLAVLSFSIVENYYFHPASADLAYLGGEFFASRVAQANSLTGLRSFVEQCVDFKRFCHDFPLLWKFG